MAKITKDKTKDRIVSTVKRDGYPLSAAQIGKRVALANDSALDELLNELVEQGRLTRSNTLLASGDTGFIYHGTHIPHR